MPNGFNRFAERLLRSPLHPLLSGSVMLLTVTGRKTGRTYTTPVNYVRDGDTVTVFSRPARTWWRNLRGAAPVTVCIRGRELQGTGEVVAEDQQAVAEGLRRARPGWPEKRIERLASDGVLLRVTLHDRAP